MTARDLGCTMSVEDGVIAARLPESGVLDSRSPSLAFPRAARTAE